MNIEVVTTFHQEGWRCYGQRFVESFLEHWPCHLTVYAESQDAPMLHPNLTWLNLDSDPDRKRFIAEHGSDPVKVGKPEFPNGQAIRFCHKVFAVTGHPRNREWMIWLDADVVTKRKVTEDHLQLMLPESASLSFLGRPLLPYTECGFIGYRTGDPRVRAMLDDMRSYYTTGEIFTRPQKDWHDSRCFDICRLRSTVPKERQHNLSDRIQGWNPWPLTVLGEVMEHHKGPGRKMRAYGSIA